MFFFVLVFERYKDRRTQNGSKTLVITYTKLESHCRRLCAWKLLKLIKRNVMCLIFKSYERMRTISAETKNMLLFDAYITVRICNCSWGGGAFLVSWQVLLVYYEKFSRISSGIFRGQSGDYDFLRRYLIANTYIKCHFLVRRTFGVFFLKNIPHTPLRPLVYPRIKIFHNIYIVYIYYTESLRSKSNGRGSTKAVRAHRDLSLREFSTWRGDGG